MQPNKGKRWHKASDLVDISVPWTVTFCNVGLNKVFRGICNRHQDIPLTLPVLAEYMRCLLWEISLLQAIVSFLMTCTKSRGNTFKIFTKLIIRNFCFACFEIRFEMQTDDAYHCFLSLPHICLSRNPVWLSQVQVILKNKQSNCMHLWMKFKMYHIKSFFYHLNVSNFKILLYINISKCYFKMCYW